MPKVSRKEHYQIYLKQIEAISKVANLITSGLYLDELLRLIVHVTAEIMNSKISSLMLLDPENKELSSERLALIDAARITIANGLRLLGISTPKKM